MVEDDKMMLETYGDDAEWTLEKFESNFSLCDLEQILAKDDLSLKDFSLPVPNLEKEQFIQNCHQDHHIAEENDLSVEKVKMVLKPITLCSTKTSSRYLTISKILLLPQTGMGY